jgi:hypothetical protein
VDLAALDVLVAVVDRGVAEDVLVTVFVGEIRTGRCPCAFDRCGGQRLALDPNGRCVVAVPIPIPIAGQRATVAVAVAVADDSGRLRVAAAIAGQRATVAVAIADGRATVAVAIAIADGRATVAVAIADGRGTVAVAVTVTVTIAIGTAAKWAGLAIAAALAGRESLADRKARFALVAVADQADRLAVGGPLLNRAVGLALDPVAIAIVAAGRGRRFDRVGC